MVVVTGAGTVVCCEVVVVLLEGVDEQAHNDTRAAAMAHGTMSLFMSMTSCWLVDFRPKVTTSAFTLYGVLAPLT